MKIRKVYLIDIIDLKGLKRFNLVLSEKRELEKDKPLILYFGREGQTVEELEVELKNSLAVKP